MIKIFTELIETNPKLDKKPEIYARILQRINDEEGVKKLVIELFKSVWFEAIKLNSMELNKKVIKLKCIIKSFLA